MNVDDVAWAILDSRPAARRRQPKPNLLVYTYGDLIRVSIEAKTTINLDPLLGGPAETVFGATVRTVESACGKGFVTLAMARRYCLDRVCEFIQDLAGSVGLSPLNPE